ncbi:hypothetical protein ACFLRB_06415, partial [Acidobacteriota bacterium]
GTGYSYSIPAGHYAKNEKDLSRQLYFAMQGFYERHPEYRVCPLYVTGESYGGKYVPSLAWEIVQMNKSKKYLHINLKGISLGDGWIDPFLHLRNEIEYAYNLGFIDTGQKKRIEEVYQQVKEYRKNGDYFKAYKLGNMIPEIIMACGGNVSFYDVRSFTGTPVDYIVAYFNSKKIKEALGVPCCVDWTLADISYIEANVKYEGYIKVQERNIKRLSQLEKITLPEDIDYSKVDGLSTEVRQKLHKSRPVNLKEALAIPGITPASLNAISIYLTLQAKKRGATRR